MRKSGKISGKKDLNGRKDARRRRNEGVKGDNDVKCKGERNF